MRLRFRLRQGREVQLYYKSRIEVDIGRLEALMEKLDANLEVKKGVAKRSPFFYTPYI